MHEFSEMEKVLINNHLTQGKLLGNTIILLVSKADVKRNVF